MNNHSGHTKLILAVVAGVVVLVAFGGSALSYLPLLAILAICPLMMIFMMKGMNHGGGSNLADDSSDQAPGAHRH